RTDSHVRSDDGTVNDHRALVDPGARIDLDLLPYPRAGAGRGLRDRDVGIGAGDRAELTTVALLPRVTLAHLRTGACPGLRRRHDLLPPSSRIWAYPPDVDA